jgi:DNA-binding MarR family transcriptional regulator
VNHDNSNPSSRALNSLRRLVRAIGTSRRGASGDVSGAQLFALRQISASPGLSVNELASRTMARQSTVSELVSKMVADGLVLRRTDTEDARQAHLHLTARGKKAVSNSATTVQEKLIAGVERLTPHQREALSDSLEAWITAAGLDDVAPAMFYEHPE